MSERSLSILVYGPSKVGKSTFTTTAPGPRLLFDVEAAARFLPGRKTYWNPLDPKTPKPPEDDGTWDTCVVVVNDFEVVLKAYEWLKSGKHSFRSVILDSVSELQVKAQEAVAGRSKLKIQDWGELSNKIGFFCRDLRDLTAQPDSPIEAVVVTAMEKEKENEVRPFLQGQVVNQIPYWFDATTYIFTDQVEDEENEGETRLERFLLLEPDGYHVAGNRMGGRLPDVIEAPNIEDMISAVFD